MMKSVQGQEEKKYRRQGTHPKECWGNEGTESTRARPVISTRNRCIEHNVRISRRVSWKSPEEKLKGESSLPESASVSMLCFILFFNF